MKQSKCSWVSYVKETLCRTRLAEIYEIKRRSTEPDLYKKEVWTFTLSHVMNTFN